MEDIGNHYSQKNLTKIKKPRTSRMTVSLEKAPIVF